MALPDDKAQWAEPFPWDRGDPPPQSRKFTWTQLKVAIQMYNGRRLDGRPTYSRAQIAAYFGISTRLLDRRIDQYRAWLARTENKGSHRPPGFPSIVDIDP